MFVCVRWGSSVLFLSFCAFCVWMYMQVLASVSVFVFKRECSLRLCVFYSKKHHKNPTSTCHESIVSISMILHMVFVELVIIWDCYMKMETVFSGLFLSGNDVWWHEWTFSVTKCHHDVTELDSTWFQFFFHAKYHANNSGVFIARPRPQISGSYLCAIQHNCGGYQSDGFHHCTNLSFINFGSFCWLFSHSCFSRQGTKSWSPRHFQRANSKL